MLLARERWHRWVNDHAGAEPCQICGSSDGNHRECHGGAGYQRSDPGRNDQRGRQVVEEQAGDCEHDSPVSDTGGHRVGPVCPRRNHNSIDTPKNAKKVLTAMSITLALTQEGRLAQSCAVLVYP